MQYDKEFEEWWNTCYRGEARTLDVKNAASDA